jgi:hypothetical protein
LSPPAQDDETVDDRSTANHPQASEPRLRKGPKRSLKWAWLGTALGLVAAVATGVFRKIGWLVPGEATTLGAVGAALFVGVTPGLFLHWITPEPDTPTGVDKKFWEQLMDRGDAGFWIGTAERLLVVAAILAQVPTLIAAWLAFKLASKWEVWKNVVQLPEKLDGCLDRNWLLARHTFGSWLLNRFWLGTLLNILGGIIAAYAGARIGRIPPQ